MALLLPVLLLLLLFLAGSLKVILQGQSRMALRSRLDVCAIRLATNRAQSLNRLARLNQALVITVVAIYAARGVKLIGGPLGLLVGGVSEAALLKANHALASLQEATIALFQARESSNLACLATPFSREPVLCQAIPGLQQSLTREKLLFADTKGALQHRQTTSGPLARFRCLTQKRQTIVALRGDAKIRTLGFVDTYEE